MAANAGFVIVNTTSANGNNVKQAQAQTVALRNFVAQQLALAQGLLILNADPVDYSPLESYCGLATGFGATYYGYLFGLNSAMQASGVSLFTDNIG